MISKKIEKKEGREVKRVSSREVRKSMDRLSFVSKSSVVHCLCNSDQHA